MIRTETRCVYIASDGKEFLDIDEAQKYDQHEQLLVFFNRHGFIGMNPETVADLVTENMAEFLKIFIVEGEDHA